MTTYMRTDLLYVGVVVGRNVGAAVGITLGTVVGLTVGITVGTVDGIILYKNIISKLIKVILNRTIPWYNSRDN